MSVYTFGSLQKCVWKLWCLRIFHNSVFTKNFHHKKIWLNILLSKSRNLVGSCRVLKNVIYALKFSVFSLLLFFSVLGFKFRTLCWASALSPHTTSSNFFLFISGQQNNYSQADITYLTCMYVTVCKYLMEPQYLGTFSNSLVTFAHMVFFFSTEIWLKLYILKIGKRQSMNWNIHQMALTLLSAATTAQLTSMELLSVTKKLVNVLVHLASSLIWTGLQIADTCRQTMAAEDDFCIGCQVNSSSTLHGVHRI